MKKATAIPGKNSKTLVRPHHLKYSLQFWLPIFKKDKLRLEQVWRTATRLTIGTDNLDCKLSGPKTAVSFCICTAPHTMMF